jgi:hypothetical protein
MKTIKIIAITCSVLVLTGIIYNDTKRFDTTDGAYEYPYTGYTGAPFDFENFKLNEVGFRDTRGIILEFQIDCTTGLISGFFGPIPIKIKNLSERAIVVHKPQVACLEVGFAPQWKY